MVYSSADGFSWETSNTAFFTVTLFEFDELASKLFFASGILEGSGTQTTFASRDGLDWFLTDWDAYPRATGDGAGFRIRNGWSLQRARLDGAEFPAPLRVRVEGDGLVREAPARWEVHAAVEEPEEVVRIELWRDDALVATRGARDARFTVEAAEPFIGLYTVRAYYEDGWVSVSGEIPLRVLGGRLSTVKDLPGLTGGRMESVHYYPVGGYLYARPVNSLTHLQDGPFQRTADGVDWTPLTSGLEQGRHFPKLLLPDSGTPLLLRNLTSTHPLIGSLVTASAVVDLHAPEAAVGFSRALFVFEGTIHLLALSGDLFRMRSDRSWEFLRNTRPTADFYPERTGSQIPIRVDSGKGLHVLTVGDTSGSGSTLPPSARLLTRDFREYRPVPQLEHRGFGGITSDGSELLYRSNDKRALAFVDEDGRILREIVFPLPVDAWHYIGDGTLVASAAGVAFLTSRHGGLWPIESPPFDLVTFWRDATRLGIFGNRGEIRMLAVQDFRVAAVRDPDIKYGPENRLRGNVTLRHAGGMSTGEVVNLAVRAFLQPADADGDAVPLGNQSVDASRWLPGRNRTFQLEWTVPAAARLGEYTLAVEVNYDGAVDEADTSGNIAQSARFTYIPSPSVVLESAPFGTAYTDQLGTHIPYGSVIRVEARPEPGFIFVGWDRMQAGSQPILDVTMDQPHRLRPRFVHESVAAAFPWIEPVAGEDWFADASGLFFATVTPDWNYHDGRGWFRIGEVFEAGSWLWFPGFGWRFRPPGIEVYFDPVDQSWEMD
ncbi:MAG: hypothetical protein JJU00_11510 [Opitutales bacterium]|nr:hypothetical protein [Opitutales bacterium]